jgi:propionyl-CoA carboxylase alpha chain
VTPPIGKLLVANRGEVARRVLRTCHRLGIATVAVFSDADREAPFVAEAGEAVPLGGVTPAESYLRAEAIVAAAERTGADAVHPGWGFLAESADFAERCRKRDLTFIGPSPEALRAMGNKPEAKRLVAEAGVPVLPGGEAGFPVMVKAVAGGGGVGMRVVADPAELEEAMAAARRAAAGAFGDGEVFLERYLERARHVEVQIAGDAHGRLLPLYERECSIQRRHQKVIEEAPSPAVDDALRSRLGELAVAAGHAVGCTGLATVEFLLADGELWFLEMNPRLQVEHPVTECVTGWDLVALQLRLAEGQPLPAAPPALDGHAVEARLYAEDPGRGFLPAAGTLHRFRVDARPGLRVDAGVADGSRIDPHYDPLLAKVIAHAPTRAEAARLLAAALEGARLHGPPTNRELLVRVLRHPAFLAGEVDTGFLERLVASAAPQPGADAGAAPAGPPWLNAVAAALAGQAERRAGHTLPSGWRNNPSQLQRTEFEGASVGYRLGRDGVQVEVDGQPRQVRLWSCGPLLVALEADGVLRCFEVHRVGELVYVDGPLGPSALRELPRLPEPAAAERRAAGSLAAPLPGVVRRVAARAGERVEAGALLVVLEAMKTEHRVTAPHAGTVAQVLVADGQEVGAGTVLVVLPEEASPAGGAGERRAPAPSEEEPATAPEEGAAGG